HLPTLNCFPTRRSSDLHGKGKLGAKPRGEAITYLRFLFVDLGFRFPNLLHSGVILRVKGEGKPHLACLSPTIPFGKHHQVARQRSEERRVGKEYKYKIE